MGDLGKYSVSTRNSSIELLRILLMYAILLWHILVHGGGVKLIGTGNYVMHDGTLFELIACCVLCIAVDCFIFMSGYYGIKFKTKTFISFILMGLFYSVLTYCLSVFVANNGTDMRKLYLCLCPITEDLWWFLTDYLYLYLISGFLNKLVKLSNTKLKLIVMLSLVYLFLFLYHLIVRQVTGHSGVAQFFNMIFVYVLGRSMGERKIHINGWYCLGGCQILLVVCTLFLFYVVGEDRMMWRLFSNGNPLVIMSAIGLFYIFHNYEFHNSIINKYASGVIAIYLFTDAFLSSNIYSNLYKMLYNNCWLMLVCIIVGGSSIVLIERLRKRYADVCVSMVINRFKQL